MAILAAFLVAVLVAALLYEGLPVAASVRVEQYETVAGLRPAGQGRLPFWRAVLVPFNRLGRCLPSSLAGRARRQLYWAQRAGAWVGWDEASFLGLRLAGAVVGFLLTASAPMGILVAGAFLGWWLPGMMLAGRARRVERAAGANGSNHAPRGLSGPEFGGVSDGRLAADRRQHLVGRGVRCGPARAADSERAGAARILSSDRGIAAGAISL